MKKNKYTLIAISCLLLIVLPLASCLTAPASNPTPAAPADPVLHLSDLTAIKAELAQKAALGSISALEQRMAQAEGKINTLQSAGPGNAYTKTETYTKAEVDAAVLKAINDLKTAAPWGTSTGSSGGSTTSTTPTTGQVTFSVNPASLSPISSWTTGSNAVWYTIHVMNGTNSWQYVKPIITLNLTNTSTQPQIASMQISISGSGCQISQSIVTTPQTAGIWLHTGGICPTIPGDQTCALAAPCFSCPMQISISPLTYGSNPVTASLLIMPISGCYGSGEISVGPSQTTDIQVAISNLATTTQATWIIGNTISNRNMY